MPLGYGLYLNAVGKKIRTMPTVSMMTPPIGLVQAAYFSPRDEVAAKAAVLKIIRSSSMKKKS